MATGTGLSSTSNVPPPIPDPPAVVPAADPAGPGARGAVAIGGGLPLFPRTLRGQVVLPIVLVVLIGMVSFGVVMLNSTRDLYVDRLDTSLTADARLVAALAVADLPAAAETSITDGQAFAVRVASSLGSRVTVIRPDGTVLGDSLLDPATMPNQRLNPTVGGASAGTESITQGLSQPGGETYRYASVPVRVVGSSQQDLVVRVGSPTGEVEAEIAEIRRLVLILATVVLVTVAAVTLFTVDRVATGIGQARSHARRIAAGTIRIDTRPSQVEELGDLRSSFNGMVIELQELVAEIRRSRAELESTLATLADGVILTSSSGDVVRMNAAAARILNVEPDEVIGEPFVVATRDHELNALHRQSMRTGQLAHASSIELGFDRLIIDAVAQPVVGEDNQLTLIVLRDQTELRKLEQVRREFVANVSHELRTPLASIRALVETLEAGAMDEPELANDFFGRIVVEVDRLAALVDELLDLARLESGRVSLRLEPLAPADLLTRGAERLLPQVDRARLTLDVAIAPDLPAVLADRSRIEQVLLNLVHNAIKFTPPGGTITVRAEVQGDLLLVTVHDTGVGIGPEELPRLFERFYKTDKARRSDGTGLGLAIAKHIVMTHGGTISARSVVNEGATFLFTLPLATSRAAAAARESRYLQAVETLL